LPEWLVLVLAMLAACAVVVVITLIRHKAAPVDEDPSETPDVIEYMTMMIGVIYAIVIGLAIAGVWEARGAAQDDARREAQALHEISERVQVYPAAVRDRTRADIDSYVTYVVNKEWPHMISARELTPRGAVLLDKVRRDVTDFAPKTDLANQAYQPVVDQVGIVDDARNAREQNASPTMPGMVWFGLVAGALVAVGLIFTLQIRRSPRELLLAGLYSALLAFLLFLIWDLDAPFGHAAADSTGAFLALFPKA
jgi:hypothetical protein